MGTTEPVPVLLDLLGASRDLPDYCLWLDRQLAGPGIRSLVKHLQGLRGPTAVEDSITDILGTELRLVEQAGLRTVSRERLASLLAHPELLYDLQEYLLGCGEPYWDSLAAEVNAVTTLVAVAAGETDVRPADTPSRGVAAWQTRVARANWSRRAVWPLAAAGLLLALLGWWPRTSPRGWERPEVWVSGGSSVEYLGRISNAAEDYNTEKQASAVALDGELQALVSGCDRLLGAKLPPFRLTPEGKDLKTLCRDWRQSFVSLRKQLTDRPGEWIAIRSQAGKVLEKMKSRLKAMGDAEETAA